MSNKILVLDVETSPIIAYVWGLRDQNVSLNQIKEDWHLIAWAAKWLGDPASKVMYMDQRNAKDIKDDRKLLEPLWKLLNEADMVVTQNGQRFDGPRLNARFIMHGMRPPKPYKHLDTYQIVRRVADFTSNKLEYLTDKLCKKYKKLPHADFAGMKLWVECLAGNRKAWDSMKKYNIHDVLSTEELYTIVRAWTPSSMPVPHSAEDESKKCGACGSSHINHRGYGMNKKSKYPKFQCQECGHWQKGNAVSFKKAA